MRKTTTDPLRGQAETFVAAADAAAGWFRDHDAKALNAARTARLRSRSWREESVAAARTRSGPVKDDISAFSFSLREAVESLVAAVCEAVRLDAPADEDLTAAAVALSSAARALLRAASAKGETRAEALVEAKRHAAEVERRRRTARQGAHESALFVASIKLGGVSGCFGAAAEATQQACDALAGSLGE